MNMSKSAESALWRATEIANLKKVTYGLWYYENFPKDYRKHIDEGTFGVGHKFSFTMHNSQPVYTLHPLNILYGPLSRWLKNTAPEDTGV